MEETFAKETTHFITTHESLFPRFRANRLPYRTKQCII